MIPLLYILLLGSPFRDVRSVPSPVQCPRFLCTLSIYFPGGAPRSVFCLGASSVFCMPPGLLPVGFCSCFGMFFMSFDSNLIAYFVSTFYLLPPLCIVSCWNGSIIATPWSKILKYGI